MSTETIVVPARPTLMQLLQGMDRDASRVRVTAMARPRGHTGRSSAPAI
jgi:hypothetical protein